MDTLKTIFSKVKCFESNTKLHAIVFIAQEINIIGKNEYNFDYSLNLPFSESLERDYLMLRDEGFVYEDEEGHIVVNDQLNESVNASQIDKIDKLIDEEKISILQKLSIFETKDLINIVVYYHRTVRAIELMIGETISSIMKELIPENPKDDLKRYSDVTEHSFFCKIDQIRNKNNLKKLKIVSIWDSVFNRNITWKQLEESERLIHNPRELYTNLTASELEMRIKNDTGLEPKKAFIVDSPAIETSGNVFSFSGDLTQKDKIVIYYNENRQSPVTIDNLAATFHIPIKAIQYRMYVRKDLLQDQKSKLSRSFKKHTSGEEGYLSSLDSSF